MAAKTSKTSVHHSNSVDPQELFAENLQPSGDPTHLPEFPLPRATSATHNLEDSQPESQNAHPTSTMSIEEPFAFLNSFEDKAIRHAFIRKVYLILMSQLLLTAGIIAFFIFHGVFIFIYFALACCSSVRRKYPGNFICLLIFTLSLSYMTGTISSYYETEIALIAVGITAVVCLSVTCFAFQTKTSYSCCGGLIFSFCMVLSFTGVACLIVTFTLGKQFILRCVYGGIGALIFSLFLACDTIAVLNRDDDDEDDALSPEEYVFAALQLYLDVIQILCCILAMFGGGGGGD